MAKPLRPKRGTTAKNDVFVGLASEITIDTDKHSIRVHDGVTAGGHELLPIGKNDARYVRTVNGKAPTNGNVTVDVPSTDGLIKKSGNRGSIGGYNTPSVLATTISINEDSNDDIQYTSSEPSSIDVVNGSAGTSWVKTVSMTTDTASVTLGTAWKWIGGEAPTIVPNCVLVFYWNNSFGIANLLKGE